MSEVFRFYPEDKTLFVEVLGNEYLKRQPADPDAAKAFAESLKPIVEQVETMMRSSGMREVLILNLKGVGLTSLNPKTATQLISLLYTIRSDDESFMDRVEIHNSNPVFEMLYKQVKKSLPAKLVEMIKFIS